ncbi:MAG: YiiX family permuted papain-like enzyme [Candidatus Zixiibacteriota bacterium]
MRYLLVLATLVVLCSVTLLGAEYQARTGDVLFQTTETPQSSAIQLATKSPYCHVGIVFIRDSKPFVLEAVEPAKFTPMNQWITRGANNHYVAKRLVAADSILTSANIAKLLAEGKTMTGKHYDIYFQWSDSTVYCSELVWKVYRRALGIQLGTPGKLKDFDLANPIVAAKLIERFGQTIPYEETVVAPSTIFDSNLLETVYINK